MNDDQQLEVTEHTKYGWVDPVIMLIIVGVVAALLLVALFAILVGHVEQSEETLLSGIESGAWTVFVAIAGYYWGTSKSSRQKDETIYKLKNKD